MLGTVGAAAGMLAVVGVIAVGTLGGNDSPAVSLGDPSTGSAPSTTVSSAPPHTPRPAPSASIRPVSGPMVTTVPASSPVASGAASGRPSPTLGPGAPSLGRTPGTPDDLHSSDKQVKLTVGSISPGTGTLASITIAYDDGTRQVPVTDPKAASLQVVVAGLSNGRPYTFTAKVCSSTKLCTASPPFTFTPYGAPEVQQPLLTATGLEVKVKALQVIRHSHPGQTTCSVSVTPAEGTPQHRSVDPEGESFTFTGKASTAYTATERCSTDDISDGSVMSSAVTTGAAPPSVTPSPSASASVLPSVKRVGPAPQPGRSR